MGSSPEAYAAVYQSAIIEIATEHGRHDLVDRVMREGVRIVDKEAFAAETGFTPDSLVSASTIGISTDVSALSSTQELRYTPDRFRRPPRRGGVPCTCSSLVCSADVCGRYYCSGACGGCNLCG